MSSEQVIEQIEAGRIIAILRGDFGGREEEIVDALVESGITAVEATLNSPGAIDSIAVWPPVSARGSLSAGTVLRPEEVERAADAGASFIVSPNLNAKVIEVTKRLGLISLPGCFTPPRSWRRWRRRGRRQIVSGAMPGAGFYQGDARTFAERPPDSDGRRHARSRARLHRRGAWALGIGSELIGKDVMNDEGFRSLRRRASDFAEAARGAAK